MEAKKSGWSLLFGILAVLVSVGAGVYLLGTESASEEATIFDALMHGMGAYFIARGDLDAARADAVSATIDIHDRLLPGKTRAAVLAGVAAAAAEFGGYTTTTPSPSTAVLTWKHRPTWAIIVGVIGLFVFLIGALFFLVKETDTVTVTAIDEPGGVRVSAVGTGDPELVGVLQGFLDPATEW